MPNTISENKRVLGLDWGHRRIGIAISDSDGMLATPYSTIAARDAPDDINAILAIVEQEGVGLILVGLPFSLDGTVGPQAKSTLDFCHVLRAASQVPVETWDERYTTAEAERLLRSAGVSPSRDRDRLNSTAAAVLLQSYLDAYRDLGRRSCVDEPLRRD